MASVALVGANGLLLSPVLTDIAGGFGVPVGVAGRALAAYSAGTALTAIWLGRSLDGFGLSRALALAMVLVGLAQLGSALAGGWGTLALFQGLAGAGAGVALPAVYGITAQVSPPGQEARTMSRVIFGWSLAMVAAVPLGAFLADILGWRAMLGLTGAVAIVAAGLNWFFLPSSGRRSVHLRMGRFAPLALPQGWQQYLITLLFMMAFYGVYAYLGDQARSRFGVSASAAGLNALTYGAGFGLAVFGAGLVDRAGRARALPVALTLTGSLLASLWLPPAFPLFLAMIFLWGFLNHFILNMIVVGLNALAPEHRGAVMGLYSSVTYTGATLGVLLMGALYEGAGFMAVALCAAAFNFAALGLALRK